MKEISLPKKINPCPIYEAIVEVRFDSDIPADAIFGLVYNEFKGEYPTTINLPILQLPEAIRVQDPNLIYKPLHRLTDGTFLFNVGPKVISLINKEKYEGWSVFSAKIKDCFKRVGKLDIMRRVTRFGIRYINFFEGLDVYDKINLKTQMNGRELESEELNIRTLIKSGKFTSKLQITNKGELQKEGATKEGSILDIDTSLEGEDDITRESLELLIENGHLEEKKLFFSLLQKRFVEEDLNAQY